MNNFEVDIHCESRARAAVHSRSTTLVICEAIEASLKAVEGVLTAGHASEKHLSMSLKHSPGAK